MPRSPLVVLATAIALAATACSVSKTPHPSTPTSATTPHAVYEQCLIQHGVPTPPPGPPPGPEPVPAGPLPGPPGTSGATIPPPPPGVDQATWDNAQRACASLQPTPPSTGP
ncbi:MAG TPA: hypothetical protein VH496_12190 [Mycobacterium sp.]